MTWKIYFLSALIDHIVQQPEVLTLLLYAGGISSQNIRVMTRIFQINYNLRVKPAKKKKKKKYSPNTMSQSNVVFRMS